MTPGLLALSLLMAVILGSKELRDRARDAAHEEFLRRLFESLDRFSRGIETAGLALQNLAQLQNGNGHATQANAANGP
jgi:hypothetical protein